MYIEHFRREFYELLIGSRVLIIAAPDIDSVCSVKILLTLFHIDGIAYTLVCAEGNHEMREHFLQFKNQVKNVILVNCGGTVDVMDLLDNPKDVIIYILDTHRPTHVFNIYDESERVRIVIPPDDSERMKIPKFDEIFHPDGDSDNDFDFDSSSGEDENENGEESEGGDVNGRKRKQRNKRAERKAFNQLRDEKIREYTEYSYYGAPASLIMLEVAWTMSRGDAELVWYSIIGLTDSYIMEKMDREHYVSLTMQLQNHVARIKHSQQNQRDIVKLNFENELRLFLYRHWNVYQSLEVTPYFACKFKFWMGEKQLNRFLLDLGLPLTQCRQKFVAMDLKIRNTLKDIFEKKANKWGISEITVPSFSRQVGMKRKYSAFDCHLAAVATLELPMENKTMSQKFKAALDCLPSDRSDELDKGVEAAKILLKTIRQQVEAFIDTHSVHSVGPFLLATVSEGAIDTKFFVHQNSLILLARFTLMAAVESSRSSRMAELPLVLVAPHGHIPDSFLVIGVSPLGAECGFNLFGGAFERVKNMLAAHGAESEVQNEIALDSFETFIAQISGQVKKKFIDKLLEVMESE